MPTSPASQVKLRPDAAFQECKSLMAINIAQRDICRQVKYRSGHDDRAIARSDNVGMARRRIYFREHRKKKGLTQKQAAERMDISQGHLSDLERGVKQYTQPIIEAMCDAYSVDEWELFGKNPLIKTSEVTHLVDVKDVPEAQRPAIYQLVEALKVKAP